MDVTNDDPCYIFFDGRQRILKATRKIRQGETICSLPSRSKTRPDKYSIEISPGTHIDCEYSMVGAINHSCEPNAAVRNMRIVAWSCIERGEPITIDYKRTETTLAEPFDCECGAKNCRGRIT